MMKYFLILFALAAVVLSGYGVIAGRLSVMPVSVPVPTPTEAPVDISARFTIFTHGTKRIFTDSRYHNLSPDVYIAPDDPESVHVRSRGITWADFFTTLPMQLTKDCLVTGTKQTFCTGSGGTLRFFINGNEDENALEREIREGDMLLVEYKS